MGYSHAWARTADIPAAEFEAWLGDLRRIIATARPLLGLFGGIRVSGSAGFGAPVLGPTLVAFNGSALFSQAHESFIVHRSFRDYRADAKPDADGLFWDACKTAQKPYDTVVVAALLAFLERVASARLSSDGARDDWQAGAALFHRALRRDPSTTLARLFAGP